jgi:hypothetical protein
MSRSNQDQADHAQTTTARQEAEPGRKNELIVALARRRVDSGLSQADSPPRFHTGPIFYQNFYQTRRKKPAAHTGNP